jgi:antitoxin VapB
MPALNIKNAEAYKLADEIARRTGENKTQAVTKALRERLDRIRRPEKGGLAERLLAIGRDCAAHLEEPLKSMDIDEFLYDEKGLFK